MPQPRKKKKALPEKKGFHVQEMSLRSIARNLWVGELGKAAAGWHLL